MSPWTIYFILMLDSLLKGLVFIGLVMLVLVIFSVIDATLETPNWEPVTQETKDKLKRRLIRIFSVIGIVICLGIMIPNTKQAATIYVLPKIINNEQAQQVPKKLLDLFDSKVDEWTKENLK